jgi:hypothetical protein
VEKQGGLFLKLSGKAGLPDRLLLLPGGRCAFVEVKVPAGTVRATQLMWLARLRSLGFQAVVVRSTAELGRLMRTSWL